MTYHSPLAVGIVREQMLARQRQIVGANTVTGRLALLHNTEISSAEYLNELVDLRRSGDHLYAAPLPVYLPVRPQNALNKVFAVLGAREGRAARLLVLSGHDGSRCSCKSQQADAAGSGGRLHISQPSALIGKSQVPLRAGARGHPALGHDGRCRVSIPNFSRPCQQSHTD